MKSPSEYAARPFGAMRLLVVDAGTVVKDDRTGQEIEVTDTSSAVKGPVIWCTQRTYDEIKNRIN